MNKTHFLLLCSILFYPLAANAQSEREITTENEADGAFESFMMELPGYRPLKSGSKIIVEYEGEWPEEMKGAFEYAAKIWEENLPMTLPIRIQAILDPRGIGMTNVSTVIAKTVTTDGYMTEDHSFLTSAIKASCMQDYHHIKDEYRFRFQKDTTTCKRLSSTDITIKYNARKLSEFSFNLDAVSENKYDFVTLALRDIALGLGFGHSIVAVNSEQRMDYSPEKPTLYESIIINAIGEDPYEAYKNATSGTVGIGYFSLYAPSPFQNGKSLRYIVSNNNNGFYKIMSPDLCKGVAVRDISSIDYEWLFKKLFDWDWLVWTGNTNALSEDGNTEDTIPFSGSFHFSFDTETDLNNIEDLSLRTIDDDSSSEDDNYENFIDIKTACEPYGLDLEVTGGANWTSIAHYVLSAQLKDGRWDPLYSQPTFTPFEPEGFNVDLSSLEHHFDENEYARSTSGGLKYRLVEITPSTKSNTRESFRVKYFTREFSPQTPVIKYSKIHESPTRSRSSDVDYDDYYVDVEIGLNGIEGTTHIMVDQYDGDDTMGFFYDVEDFRKGYFIANLDRELNTRLRIFAYNENGSRISNTISIPPIGWPDLEPEFKYIKDGVSIEQISSRLIEKGNITYEIRSAINPIDVKQGTLASDRIIDFSDLNDGIYILQIRNREGLIGTSKFTK